MTQKRIQRLERLAELRNHGIVQFMSDISSNVDQPTPPDPVASSTLPDPHLHSPKARYPQRRRLLPISLFLLTCVSTGFAGAASWNPGECLESMWRLGSLDPLRRIVLFNWQEGVYYMACLLAILLTHEMGHFLATVLYRIPASWPYFIPLPIAPFGTMGAVIGMDGLRANRREMFDIGLAGPLAGLVVCVPVMWIGLRQLDLTPPDPMALANMSLLNKSTAGAQFDRGNSLFRLDMPLALRFAFQFSKNPAYHSRTEVGDWQLNPFFMAGWVGLLITGLNMMPVSQLDGGHVIYTLLGPRSHLVARGFVIFAILFVIYSQEYGLSLMLALVMFVGTDHPPTRDDKMSLGWPRTLLGWLSFSIPVLCFPPRLVMAWPVAAN